jgi:hypothetical protein
VNKKLLSEYLKKREIFGNLGVAVCQDNIKMNPKETSCEVMD